MKKKVIADAKRVHDVLNAKRIQDDLKKKVIAKRVADELIKPIDEGVKIIKNIPKTIAVDIKYKITKDLPAVLMPIAITVMKDIMPKPKPIQNDVGLPEYGIYQNDDGSYWQSDATGFHPYVPNDPVYSQDNNGNYWVDYGDGRGFVPYTSKVERLQNGFYEDATGDFWEQSDEGLKKYTPQMEPLPDGYYLNTIDGIYWVREIFGTILGISHSIV